MRGEGRGGSCPHFSWSRYLTSVAQERGARTSPITLQKVAAGLALGKIGDLREAMHQELQEKEEHHLKQRQEEVRLATEKMQEAVSFKVHSEVIAYRRRRVVDGPPSYERTAVRGSDLALISDLKRLNIERNKCRRDDDDYRRPIGRND